MIKMLFKYGPRKMLREFGLATIIITLLCECPWLNGHLSFDLPYFGNQVTIYGANAMWFAINFHTQRWGYICFRPPTGHPKLRWSFYVSPNGTPWASTYAIGNVSKQDKIRAPLRRLMLGHNFRRNTPENKQIFASINGWGWNDQD